MENTAHEIFAAQNNKNEVEEISVKIKNTSIFPSSNVCFNYVFLAL